jgi:hypothetical protein
VNRQQRRRNAALARGKKRASIRRRPRGRAHGATIVRQ